MPRGRTGVITGSPAGAAETVIATLGQISVPLNDIVDLDASCDITIGTGGTAVTLKIRRGTDTTGTVLATWGPFTVVAGNRVNLNANATDTQAGELYGQQYVLTCTVTGATAQSTVNAVYMGSLY